MIKCEQQKCDVSLIDCWKKIARERIKLDIDNETISFRRGTKSIANLLMTDTEVRNRLVNEIIEDDRSKKYERNNEK